MNELDLRALLVLAILASLLARVVSAKWRIWSLKDWTLFLGHLAASAGLVWLAFLMATGVDSHLAIAGPRHSGQRIAYVIILMLAMLYGIVSFVQTLRSASGDDYNPALLRGYLHAFSLLFVIMGLSFWVADGVGAPVSRVAAVVGGGFGIWLGAAMPPWLEAAAKGRVLTSALTSSQLRVLYLGLGLAATAAGVMGLPQSWFR